MVVKKVKGGYYVETSVGGYKFSKTYRNTNRTQAVNKHNQMERAARVRGDKWIDCPQFNEYN